MKFANYTTFEKDFRLFGLEYAVDHTKKLGLDAVEFICLPRVKRYIFERREDARTAKKLLDSRSLAVSCYSMYVDLLNGERGDFELVLHNIDCAAELGSPYFHHTFIPSAVYPSPRPSYETALSAVLEKAEIIAERCAGYGITCLYEPQGLYMNGVEGLSGILSEMKKRHSNVGICGDTANSFFVDTPPEDIYSAFKDDIKHIHVKDYLVSEPDGGESRYKSRDGKYIREVALGSGSVDFKKLFSLLPDYSGDISMEFDAPDEEMRIAIGYIQSLIRR